MRVAINDVLMVVNTLYVQPRILRVADTRVLEELELSFAIAERIKWTTSARLRFDSDTPSQVEKTDLDLKNGLEVQW